MQESYDHYFEEDSIYNAINKFEDMLKSNVTCYFDVIEFEIIIDYYIDQHDYLRAENAVNLAIKLHPGSNEIKYRQAQLLIQSGKPAKGLRILRVFENLESANSEFFLLKGSALNLLGKQEDATQAFDKAIRTTDSGKDEVIYSIAYSYINTRRYKLAIKYLKLAYEINPQNLAVIHELASVYERIDENEKSEKYYKLYLEQQPFNENVWLSLGMLYSNMQKSVEAIDAYDYAIAINPRNISALFSKANSLVSIDKYKEAVAVFQEIIDCEPNNAQAFVYIGECYEKLAFYKRSIYYFKRAIDIDDFCADAWYGIGIANFQQENYKESLKYVKKAKNIDPENPDFWFMLGQIYRRLNNIERSAEAFNMAVELDPNDSEAWINRAELSFRDNNDLKGAIRILNKAYEFNPDISYINYQLATYYFYNNQSKLAFRHFEKGLSISYGDHFEFLSNLPTKLTKQLNPLVSKFKNKK